MVRVGPLLLCHPLVQKAPGALAIPEVPQGQTPEMRCCRRQGSGEEMEALEALGALEAPGGQVDTLYQFRWRLPAPLSPL